MTISTKKTMRKVKGKDYGPYLQQYYHCMGRSLGKECKMRWVRKDPIESIVWSQITGMIKNPSLIERPIKKHTNDSGKEAVLANKIKRMEKKIHSQKMERDRILRFYRKGRISEGEAENQLEEMRDEIRELEHKKSELEVQIEEGKHLESKLISVSRVVKFLQKRIDGLHFKEKRNLLMLLVEKIRVNLDNSLDMHLVIPDLGEKILQNLENLKEGFAPVGLPQPRSW